MEVMNNRITSILEIENRQIMNVDFNDLIGLSLLSGMVGSQSRAAFLRDLINELFNDRDALYQLLTRIKAKNDDRQIIMDFIEYSYKQIEKSQKGKAL
jgi:dihydroxyacetone kinase-like predicted kinase